MLPTDRFHFRFKICSRRKAFAILSEILKIAPVYLLLWWVLFILLRPDVITYIGWRTYEQIAVEDVLQSCSPYIVYDRKYQRISLKLHGSREKEGQPKNGEKVSA